MQSLLISLFLIVGITACGGKKGSPTVQSEDIIEGTSPVVKKSDYYKSGILIGKPVKISSSGLIFKTNEAEINMGAFGGNYIGNILRVSIEEDGLAKKFEALDSKKLYIFKFEVPHALNPEIESTHYHIRSWEPFTENTELPHRGVRSYLEKKGGFSSGKRRGKVTSVIRWGLLDIDCTVNIKIGGLGGGSTRSESENTVSMNTYSEESCAFSEQALRAGVDVEFEYSQDYIEVWDGASRILHVIRAL